jgi:enoyl-CoA hydratase/carnithine racemase
MAVSGVAAPDPEVRPGPVGSNRTHVDHPPINTITATTVAELSDLVGLIRDPDVNVVVFDSANRDFYLAHYNVENGSAGLRHSGSVPLDCPAWVDVLVRLARARVVSIASIPGARPRRRKRVRARL